MTQAEKIAQIKAIMRITDDEQVQDSEISVFLDFAEKEIISWVYSGNNAPETMPEKYEPTQMMAVVVGFTVSGAEGQKGHSENGINRTFNYEDMIAYIRSRLVPFVRIYS